MRRYELIGRQQIVLRADAAMPELGRDDVMVKVKSCTVCGRSDLAYYHYLGLRQHCAEGCFGHEIAGVIVEVGSSVARHQPGDRVFIRTPLTSGYADFAVARSLSVGRLPDSIPYDQGSILQLLPLAIHATRGIRLGDDVVIVGQGPVGLMTLQVARLRGASRITAVDLDPWRLEHARRLGADDTIVAGELPVGEMAGRFDVAIEAVGTPTTANRCVELVRQNGLVVFLGTHHVETSVIFDMVQWEKKGLRVHTAAEPTDEARVAALKQAERLVHAGKVRLDGLLTHSLPLTSLQEAMDKLSHSSILYPDGANVPPGPPSKTLKVAICP